MAHSTIGVIVVGEGAVVRRELASMKVPDVSFAFEAFGYPPPDVPFCEGLHTALLAPARKLRGSGADVVLITCTTAVMRCPRVTFSAELGTAVDLPVVSIADAMVTLAQSQNRRSLAIATPYGATNNAVIRAFFEHAGFTIPALAGLNLDSSLERWRATAEFLTSDEIAALIGQVSSSSADAICLPSSGMASAAFAASSSTPVIAGVAAGVWASLECLGREIGYGAVLAQT